MDEQRMMTAPTFLELMAPWHPRLDSNRDRLTSQRTPEKRSFRERLWTLRNLSSRLDEAVGTDPAQLMQQVLNDLHSEVLCPTLRLSQGQLTTVMSTLSELDHEATRSTPNAAQFSRRAQLVVDVLLLA